MQWDILHFRFRIFDSKCKFTGLHLQLIAHDNPPPDIGADSMTAYSWNYRTGEKFRWHEDCGESQYVDWGVESIRLFEVAKREAGQVRAVYFPNLTCGWDPNARYPAGQRRPIIHGANPVDFERFARQVKEWADANVPADMPKLITVNSWNEWTEATYLEPDDRFGYGYLNALWRVFVREVDSRK